MNADILWTTWPSNVDLTTVHASAYRMLKEVLAVLFSRALLSPKQLISLD